MSDAKILKRFDEFLGIVRVHLAWTQVGPQELLECSVCIVGGLGLEGVTFNKACCPVSDDQSILVPTQTLVLGRIGDNMICCQLLAELLWPVPKVP